MSAENAPSLSSYLQETQDKASTLHTVLQALCALSDADDRPGKVHCDHHGGREGLTFLARRVAN